MLLELKFVQPDIIFTNLMQITGKIWRRRCIKACILLTLILVIRIFSAFPVWVEVWYSTRVYHIFSAIFRLMLGWLPFSAGDILYLLVIVWFVRKVWRFSARLVRRQLNGQWLKNAAFQVLMIGIWVYIVFNILWGINYNREPLAKQMQISASRADTVYLKTIDSLLLIRVNESKRYLVQHRATYPSNADLFSRAAECYHQASSVYPFLVYKNRSVKRSMFGLFGNYFGFTGYYNPFTGESQVNTRIPRFILPYTTTHEIAHQLGYAKEEEANFAGYLAATTSTDTLFHYSAYLDLFVYANRQLFFLDSVAARARANQLDTTVKMDIAEWNAFLRKHKNPLEPLIRWAYGNYLRANQQPKGMTSYDEVIADLIAFYKKYGRI